MAPPLRRTLGVKGHRPVVGTRDLKDLLYVSAVVDAVTGQLHTDTQESPARARQTTGESQARRMREAFAAHPGHIGRIYPEVKHGRAVLIIANAPWHRGEPIDEALAEHPRLEFKRPPSYSPRLNIIERLWRLLRRRATHNRLSADLAELKRSLRASPCDDQAVRGTIRSMIAGCYAPPQEQTASAGL